MDIFGSWKKLVSVVFAKDSQAITMRPNQSTTYTAARDIQLPPGDAAHVLQSADSAQTVSNKTMDNTNTMNLKDTLWTLEDDGDANKKMRFQLSAITSGQTRTITIPDANSTMVNIISSQTLQNKIFDNTNEFTTKDTLWTLQDDGDATKQMRFQLSGITTGNTRVLTIPDASATLVGADTAQTLTNKDIDGGTAANTRRITLPKDTTANLTSLTRKEGTVVYDTATATVKYDNGTSLVELAAATLLTASADIINLSIVATDDSPTTGDLKIELKTRLVADPSASDPIKIAVSDPTGTGGSYGYKTLTAAASGITSLVIPNGATLGHTANIDEPLFIYAMSTGGGATQMELAVSTMQLDEALRYSSTALSTGADSRTVLYSTNAQSNRSVRLLGKLISNQTTAGAWSAAMTTTKLNPINLDYTVKTTTGFTPTASAAFGTTTNSEFYYYRVADRMIGSFKFKSGTASAGTQTFITLPSGIAINSAKLSSVANTAVVGSAERIRNAASATPTARVVAFFDGTNTDRIYFSISSQSDAFTKAVGGDWASSNDNVTVNFDIPVTAWAV